MEQRLIPTDLANLLAERRGKDKIATEHFVREFFRVIEDALLSESIVKVKGLGTFKLVRVEARESININTGQRFTIDEHTKVSFTPDTTLRNLINKPFSEFETVVLADDVDVDELDEIGSEYVVDDASEENTARENVSSETVAVEMTATEDVESGEIVQESVDESGRAAETDSAEHDDKSDNDIAGVVDDEVAEAESVAATSKEIDSEIKEDDEQNNAVVAQTVQVQNVTDLTVTTQHVENQTITTAPDNMEKSTSARLTIWETLALMTFILALMGVSYAAGYNHWLVGGDDGKAIVADGSKVSKTNSAVQSKVKTSEVGRPSPPTVIQPEKSVTPAPLQPEKPKKDPAVDYPQIDGADYVIVGVIEEHTVKIGESLRGLSLKYYGSKDYVKYIVKLNNIKNPDILNVGNKIKIPKLEKR